MNEGPITVTFSADDVDEMLGPDPEAVVMLVHRLRVAEQDALSWRRGRSLDATDTNYWPPLAEHLLMELEDFSGSMAGVAKRLARVKFSHFGDGFNAFYTKFPHLELQWLSVARCAWRTRPRPKVAGSQELLVEADKRALCDRIQAEAWDAKAAFETLPEKVREERRLVEPSVPTDDEVLAQALEVGGRAMAGYRAPNTIIGINVSDPNYIGWRKYRKGEIVFLETIQLPIGSEVLALDASDEDGPNWEVIGLTFGSLNVVSHYGARVALASLLHLTCGDLLSPFDGKKTKVDVQVTAQLVCKTDGATFAGYRLSLYMEEQLCCIQTRVEPADAHGERGDPFPRQRHILRHVVALVVDTPVDKMRAFLDALRTLLQATPRVWPDAAASLSQARSLSNALPPHVTMQPGIGRVSLPHSFYPGLMPGGPFIGHLGTLPGYVVEVVAPIQAGDARELAETINAVVLGLVEVAQRLGVAITTSRTQ